LCPPKLVPSEVIAVMRCVEMRRKRRRGQRDLFGGRVNGCRDDDWRFQIKLRGSGEREPSPPTGSAHNLQFWC